MSDTPKTDAARARTQLMNCQSREHVMSKFSRKLERQLSKAKKEVQFLTHQSRAWMNVCECCRDLGYEGPKAGETQIMGICRFIREAVEKGKQS